jgi:hypothetical protein
VETVFLIEGLLNYQTHADIRWRTNECLHRRSDR